MKKRIYLEKEYGYPIDEKVKLYFEFGNSIVFSTGKKIKVGSEQGIQNANVIKIVSFADIEEFYGVMEISRYTKSEVLSIESIITFFTGIPFVEYYGYKQESSIERIRVKKKKIVLKIGKKDYTSDLKLLLEKIENEKEVTISLLDRWRKANYLVQESVDANLYHDEAILNYFHIIELLAEIYKDELKEKMNGSINLLLKKFYEENLTYNPKQTSEKVNKNKGILSDLLVESELTISQKSKYFLKKFILFDELTSYFIDNLIETRNAIAHGRKIYKNNVLWPVPPFFSLSQNSYECISALSILTARLISCFAGLKCWENEWREEKECLLPVRDTFNDFIKNPNNFMEVTVESLCEGNPDNISWEAVFWYYVQEPKRFNIVRVCNAMKLFYINTQINENTACHLFNISVIFCDSSDFDISEKAKENIKLIIKKRWYPWSNYKDIYGYLEYNNISPVWYSDYLLDGANKVWESYENQL